MNRLFVAPSLDRLPTRTLTFVLTLLAIGFTSSKSTQAQQSQAQQSQFPKPDVVVIMADDMGYSDLGCFGGEIETPNLDRLASGGLRFTNFYSENMCWVSRAAMLTGIYHKTYKPNILFILADDLGYGDVGCYNAESKVPTPNLDRMAQEGMRFTDAHSPSTVCTPTRYSIMTGRMAFRLNYTGVFTGVGGPCLITEDRLTLPAMLREEGYETAMFGKWHIGMSFLDTNGDVINQNGLEAVKRIDYSRSVPDAPIHRGFDHFFGTVCCPTTDWLYAFMDGDRIPVPPTKLIDKSKLPKHEWSFDCRPGLIAPDFDHEEVDMVFLRKSLDFLQQHSKEKPDKPFFLFHSLQAVHLPSFPGKDFQGKTEAGPHGDFIFEFDYVVGQLLEKLSVLGLADNTLVIVTSDNGPEVGTVINMRKNISTTAPVRGADSSETTGKADIAFP